MLAPLPVVVQAQLEEVSQNLLRGVVAADDAMSVEEDHVACPQTRDVSMDKIISSKIQNIYTMHIGIYSL